MRRLLAVAVFVVVGCSDLTAPSGAVPISPIPQHFRDWWTELEACSGLRANIEGVDFFVVATLTVKGKIAAGQTLLGASPIVVILSEPWDGDEWLVKHEMMHALGRFSTHPPAYFNGSCGNLWGAHPITT